MAGAPLNPGLNYTEETTQTQVPLAPHTDSARQQHKHKTGNLRGLAQRVAP